jgi:hypothetical protein
MKKHQQKKKPKKKKKKKKKRAGKDRTFFVPNQMFYSQFVLAKRGALSNVWYDRLFLLFLFFRGGLVVAKHLFFSLIKNGAKSNII